MSSNSLLGIEPPPSWPENGEIEMEDISVRYAAELDAVLKGVTLTIPKGGKVRVILFGLI